MQYLASLIATLALARSAVAHGGVTSLSVGSTQYAGWSPYNGGNQATAERPYGSYNPIQSATDSWVLRLHVQ
jgi:hypothetical protein